MIRIDYEREKFELSGSAADILSDISAVVCMFYEDITKKASRGAAIDILSVMFEQWMDDTHGHPIGIPKFAEDIQEAVLKACERLDGKWRKKEKKKEVAS